jgi:alpha-galactosidase
MKHSAKLFAFAFLVLFTVLSRGADTPVDTETILTPPAPASPRITGPNIFGVRPGSPFLYTIPATGDRPMKFSVEGLPSGLSVDAASGRITGSLKAKGMSTVVLSAKNALGTDKKSFRIVVGDHISLTPAMGWNSWNCWATAVNQEKVIRSAKAMVSSGLINHGWSYINIDDTWQGMRTGKNHALQANEKFPDMKGLTDEIHQMGLKAGIYSTPWIAAYSTFPGGSSDQPDGAWTQALASQKEYRLGKYFFCKADAGQWAAWGFDYLKYDWKPVSVPEVKQMSKALRKSGRDIIFSLSNASPFKHADAWEQWAESWRTTGDIWDRWGTPGKVWQHGVSEIAFSQDRWAPHSGPGHWNDPDMLVVGYVGWSEALHPTPLTPDEQYSHISMWCLLSAPLLIGCDLERLDAFTLNLLSNDEVLALDQDALGNQATRVGTLGPVDIYMKGLEDGSKAMGFFNRDSSEQQINFDKLRDLDFNGAQHVRDLWRQKDLPDLNDVTNKLSMTIPPHGVQLYKLTPIQGK